MNDKQLEKKVRRDTAKVKKDLSILEEDSAARLSQFVGNVNQVTDKAKEDLTARVEDSVSQLSEGLEELTDDAKEGVVGAAMSVKKDVRHGLSQFNAMAQNAADKVPGGFAKKAVHYPWVAITIGLAVGLLLGILFKPAHPTFGQI
jgi:ElaB/YqjD/DUF883 family membrane-anchored ribosome-binding protein